MKIALIRPASSQVPSKSYNIQELGLAKALAEYGVESDIFLINDRKEEYQVSIVEKGKTIRVFRLNGLSIPGQQTVFYKLFSYLSRNSYDLIQVLEDSQITSVLVSLYAKKRGIPCILWQGMYSNYPMGYKRIIQIFYDLMFLPILRNAVTATISKTKMAMKYLESKKFSTNFVGLVGLDIDNFKNASFNDEQVIDKLSNKKILLYVGKIEKRRNPTFLLSVFKQLAVEQDDVALVIIGSGPLSELLRHKILEYNLTERVIFIEKVAQKEIGFFYSKASCFVFPSTYEIYGMVLLESMFLKVPVIASYTAGSNQLVDNNVDGVIVKNWNIHDWVNAIKVVINNVENRNKMGELCHEKIINKFLWEKVAPNYYWIYKKYVK